MSHMFETRLTQKKLTLLTLADTNTEFSVLCQYQAVV